MDAVRAEYVVGLVEHARLPADFSQDKADHDLAEYASRTAIPDGHGMFWLVAGGERIGRLWFGERPSRRLGRSAWLYDLEVDEPFRGRGHGRRAMQLLEAEVRARGLNEIALNVWGGNDGARRLYQSAGYFERAVEMVKELR
jgi:ribosomal protein S18 acetylase RimI-like enzyme